MPDTPTNHRSSRATDSTLREHPATAIPAFVCRDSLPQTQPRCLPESKPLSTATRKVTYGHKSRRFVTFHLRVARWWANLLVRFGLRFFSQCPHGVTADAKGASNAPLRSTLRKRTHDGSFLFWCQGAALGLRCPNLAAITAPQAFGSAEILTIATDLNAGTKPQVSPPLGYHYSYKCKRTKGYKSRKR